MAKLKRDERVCPFCAETIKASAIKCRFCQSDLTPEVAAETEPETGAKPRVTPWPRSKPAPTEESEESEDPISEVVPSPKAGRPPLYKQLTLVMAVLVALAAAGVGTLWWRAEHGSAVAAGGSLVGDDARTEVLVAAADLGQRTLSYDYKTLANDMEVARARMTSSFRKEYDTTMAKVRANTTKNKIVLQTVAVSSAIISGTEHKARVLVFVNQTTTAGTGKSANQQQNRGSLVLTLTRGDGDWAISKLKMLG